MLQFDLAVFMRQPLTSSRKALEEALSYVDTPTRRELSLQRRGGTLLYDAVVKASRDVMNSQINRKAMIVLTDGVDTGSEATIADAIDAGAARRHAGLLHSLL